MSEGVVYVLEIVHVDKKEPKIFVFLFKPHFLAGQPQNFSAVGNSRQRVLRNLALKEIYAGKLE